MIRRQNVLSSWTMLLCAAMASVSVSVSPAFGQDAQGKAASENAREQIAAKNLADKTVPADKGTAVSDDAAAAADGKALERRAGEQVADDPKGKAGVLGMSLQEADSGRVKVVEVAAASPAFDAGVLEGDELLSYQGFSADSYRKWIDGMRRLTTDAPDGATIPVIVLREGKRMSLRIRVPESHAKEMRPPGSGTLAQRVTDGQAGDVPFGPNGPPTGGGNNVVIDNSGPFGNFFNDNNNQSGNAAERAVAHIVRVNAASPTTSADGAERSPTATGSAGATSRSRAVAAAKTANGTTASRQGTRIGMAGFRNDASGMLVMVDVGGLAPGNYAVGISDPSLIGNQAQAGAAPEPGVRTPQQVTTPNGGNPRVQRDTRPANIVPYNGGQPGAARPAGQPPADQPQGSAHPRSLPQIPRTILAQVSNAGQSAGTGASAAAGSAPTPAGTSAPVTGATRPLTAPPTGQVTPSTVPPTGQVAPSGATPTGQSRVNNELEQQAADNRADRNGGAGTGSSTLNQIGTLTVDQSGTGRLQQTVEGVHVRDVVGQAIVLYAQGNASNNALPPNLDPTVDAGSPASTSGTGATRGAQITNSQGVVGRQQSAARSQQAVAGQNAAAGQTAVAAGVIRLLSDRRPTTSGNATGVDQNPTQPAANAPVPEQNPLR